ncbi:MAG: TolC family protein [Lysobacteraceae bacterium]
MPVPFVSRRRTLAAAAVAVLCAGCATAYKPPALGVAPRYGVAVRDEAGRSDRIGPAADAPRRDPADDRWWRDFGDPGLDRLIADVLSRNHDLRTTALRLQRAGLQRQQVRNDRLPSVSGSATRTDRDEIRGPRDDAQRTVSAQLSVGYEVDLWRRLAAAEEGAALGVRASTEDLDSASLSLIANACDLYFRLADVNDRLDRGQRAIENARDATALVERQFEAGAVSRLETAEAAQSLQQRIGSQARLEQQRDALRTSIAVLRGGLYWPEEDEPAAVATSSLRVDPGLPVELLGRRPDLRAAEWRLRQTLVDADRARLDAYPRLDIDVAANGSAGRLGDLLDHPVRTVTYSLLLPFLDLNGTRLRIAVARKDYDIAAEAFAQRMVDAVGEVETALAATRTIEAQARAAQATLQASMQAERLYEARYRAGAAPLRLWLDAQRARLDAEDALSQAVLAQRQNEIVLAKALGGSARTSTDPTSDPLSPAPEPAR